MKILLVEDEESLVESIVLNLELENYTVDVALNGKLALEKHQSSIYDLVILDVMLPEINGFDVCETIRLTDNKTPILFLTAKSSTSDRVKGLKIGGDDYLPKPFDLEELLLRIEKLIQRSQPQKEQNIDSYSFGENHIDFNTFEVTGIDKITQTISKKEILVLKLLTQKQGEVVSRIEIIDKVWGHDSFPSTRTIDNYILSFRKLFEHDTKNPKHFHSIRGVGYKFTD